MSVITRSTLVNAVRLVLVGIGLGVAALTVHDLATMPPPPPDSDGFAHGMAAMFGGVIIIVSLGIAAVGVALPTIAGRDDPLSFNRWQRLALHAAGLLIGGGIVAGLAVGVSSGLQWGIILWLVLVVVGIVIVSATLVWRIGEAIVRLLARAVGPRAL